MKNSPERIGFITEYIVSYESKIKALNKKGLFDVAKLFELFAIEVCNLWFNKKFTNLNDESLNYPGVDLVSDNNEIFVQVSTAQDIPSKISRTLNKIKENKSKKLTNVKEVYFFVLNNDSVDKAKDYTDINRIGNVDFEVNKHLISTRHIITRATSDLNFQIKLYDVLIKEDTKLRYISEKLLSVLEASKTIGLRDIDCLINGEYEIDRSDIVNKIRNSNCQFISVRGEAGSGKSVVCKKVVEDEPYLIYARAERFTEETDINEIWHLDLEYTLERLDNKQVFFFIDSLEFIADAPKTKFDLLKNLYELAKKHPNTKIITSCRTFDSMSFFQIDSRYSIDIYSVEELTPAEIYKIVQKYPVLNTFMSDNSYLDLIKSPFYINIIVRNITDQTNIDDENKLRSFIWENVICLKEKANNYNLRFDEIVNEIRKIVLDRAVSFSVGIDKEAVNSSILHALLSESIIIENGCTVRLKYDIFEDICFEKIIDKEFDICKGNYNTFFSSVEDLGRCCYRRYQIWISNKLLSKVNREKFIYKLIFTKDLSDKWVKQTLIGLVKSRFCDSFFDEQYADIIREGLMSEFVNITNLYAFETKIQYFKEQPFAILAPKGNGRSALIRIVYDNKLFLNSTVDSNAIKKLCSDYSKEQTYDSETAVKACSILQHYIETELLVDKKYFYSSSKIINPLLNPIYQMSEFSKEWIVSFWESQKEYFVSNDHQLHRLADELIEYTLKFTTINLVKNLPKELCELANVYWTADLNNSGMFYGSRYDSYCYDFGLNKYADSYEHSLDSLKEYRFFPNLIEYNFWIGFHWAIDFINKAVSNLVTIEDRGVDKIALKFVKTGLIKQYYADCNMWYAGTQEYKVPALISDMVYLLKNKIISLIKTGVKCNYDFKTFADNIKEYIFNDSNNIVMFSMIEDIGIEFEQELPGFALDLATCIEFVMWDISRFVSLNPGADANKLRKNIQTIVCVPNLKGRYSENLKMKFTLQDYVAHMQFVDVTKEQCYKLLDYLYSVYPNETNTAYEHLQIQKMDMRNSKIERIGDNTVAISPTITGAAKKIVEDRARNKIPITSVEKVITDFLDTFDYNNYSLDDVVNIINCLLSKICDVDIPINYQNVLITLIALTLNKSELDPKTRDDYCDVWLTGVDNILNNGSFIFEHSYLIVLFRQINSNASREIKQRIKTLILNLVMFNGDNGLIHEFGRIAQHYLKTNAELSGAIFNTIVMLSKAEMNYQKYIYDNIVSIDGEAVCEFIPNKMPQYYENDYRISSDTKKRYCRHRNEIIEKYLYNQEKLDLSDFQITDYDVVILCNIVNCGLTTQNSVFARVLHDVVRCVVEILNSTDEKYRHHDIVSIHSSFRLSDYLGIELLKNTDCIIDILFENTDFSAFRHEAVEFYQRSFDGLLPIYVDAYNTPHIRNKCETVLLALEEKINNITCSEYIRKELYRSLFMSVNGYEGDWSKVKTSYSYKDIEFLNRMFSRYGKYNFKYFMHTIHKMKLEKLLPNILPSIDTTLESFLTEKFFDRSDYESAKYIISHLIILCFVNFNEEIKLDAELIKAYEGILENLTTLNSEEAAVLLDEFRIH